MEKLTTLQLIVRLEQPTAAGMIDLHGFDLTSVNMQDERIKGQFRKVAEKFEKDHEDMQQFIDMSECNITGLDMRNYNLSNVVMRGVIAERATFINSIFSDTQLEHADLQHADFRNADLYHAKLYEADIKGANFAGAKLQLTHGLGLKRPDFVVERLGEAGSIRDAQLPEDMEKFRNAIESKIRERKKEEVPAHVPDVIEYEEAHAAPAAHKSGMKIGLGDLFGSSWLKKKDDKRD